MKSIEYVLKHNSLVQKAYISLGSFVLRAIGLFIKKDPKLVVISSLIGKSYGDSPKLLQEAMANDERFSGFKYIWGFDDERLLRIGDVESVPLNSFSYFKALLSARVWINNVSASRNLRIKPKDTIYLNTGHGVSGLKINGNAQRNRSDYDYGDVDFQCISSSHDRMVYERDYLVRSEAMVQCGMPRNDCLYNPDDEKTNELRSSLGIPENKKVILYAPTWRDSVDRSISVPLNLDELRESLSEEYVFLFRAHHLVSKSLGLEYDEFFIDATNVPNANDLLPLVDILISDYSAIVFDYSILERPILAYAYDRAQYEESWGLYRDIDDVYKGNVFYEQSALINHILYADREEDVRKAREIKRENMPDSGEATRACLDFLAKHVGKDVVC